MMDALFGAQLEMSDGRISIHWKWIKPAAQRDSPVTTPQHKT